MIKPMAAIGLGVWMGLACTGSAIGQANGSGIQAGAAAYSVESEVAAALYAASATQAAMERQYTQQLAAARKQIDALRQQVTANASAGGDETATLKAELANKERKIVELLAQQDASYAREISVYGDAVKSIASTPEGLAVLGRFNSGDQVGAIAILDDLRKARDAARMARVNQESASEARQIAALALEARASGNLTTADLIDRFEEITRLDGSEASDWITLSGLYRDAGNSPKAAAAAQKALNLAPDAATKADALKTLGAIEFDQGKLPDAEARLAQSASLLRDLAKDHPDAGRYQDGLADLYKLQGRVLRDRGNLASVVPVYNQALAAVDKLIAAEPDSSAAQWKRATILTDLGSVQKEQGELGEALNLFREALHIETHLLSDSPDTLSWQEDYSHLQSLIASTELQAGGVAEELDLFRKRETELKGLLARDPSHAVWTHALALNHLDIGRLCRIQSDMVCTSQNYTKAVEMLETLVLQDKTNVSWQRDLAQAYAASADQTGDARVYDLAEEKHRRAAGILSRLAKTDAKSAGLEFELAHLQLLIGGDLMGQRKFAQADREFTSALSKLRQLSTSDPTNDTLKSRIAMGLNTQAFAKTLLGQEAAALGLYEESLGILQDRATRNPDNLGVQHALGQTLQYIGEVYVNQSDFDKAKSYYVQSLGIIKDLAKTDVTNIAWQRDLQNGYNKVGEAAYKAKDFDAAIAAYTKALAINEHLSKQDPGNIDLLLDKSPIEINLDQARTDQKLEQAMEIIRRRSADTSK
jgi:tetratricopeptide (TPR) repeat protein